MSNEPMITVEALKEKLEKANSLQEVVEIMRASGYDVTEEMISSPTPPEGEFDENSLQDVAGGSWSSFWKGVKTAFDYARGHGWL